MIKVQEKVKPNGIALKGNMPDILTYLEREQERCPKITISKYIKRRKLETTIDSQLGFKDHRRGYDNVMQ